MTEGLQGRFQPDSAGPAEAVLPTPAAPPPLPEPDRRGFPALFGARGRAPTIRARLAGALALALFPVLLLGLVQSGLSFRREAIEQREMLQGAAVRSAAGAQTRLQAATILLETLSPGVVGLDCANRLADAVRRIPGYSNLIRFDRQGRVACYANSVPSDPQRDQRPWFRDLFQGDSFTVTSQPGANYSDEPVIVASVRAGPTNDGVLSAVIPVSSLRPLPGDRALPDGADVAVVDAQGAVLSVTRQGVFPTIPQAWIDQAQGDGFMTEVWGPDRKRRIYSVAPLVERDVFVVLSSPSRGLLSAAWLDPLSGIIFPLIAFTVALVAVLIVADRQVLRWLAYLQRIADLYARGRFNVRPVQAETAPPELRDLAETLDTMAGGIVARDQSLQDTLSQKDDLMREIHHRVKNNLQVISSLLSMQERALTDIGARQAINDTRQRITALALIYRALYQGQDIRQADLKPFLEDLTNQLMMSEMARGAVRVNVRSDALMIDPDKLAPIALFAVEAITNAQKHALAEDGGALSVEFHVAGDEARLSIADDGGGRSPPMESLEAKGVGRTLMNAFARQLRGAATMERNADGGLTATLTFPTPDAAGAGTGI